MPTIKVNGVDRSTSYRPEQLGAIEIHQIAFDGEVGQGTLPIPDPAGTYEVYAGQACLIEEGAQTIFNGFVGATKRDRGDGAIAPRRVVLHNLADENARFYGFRADGWSRPAETTRARFLAFLAAFVPAVTDTTWVLNTNVANMPKKRYRTETLFSELQQEITDLTGNTAFIEGGRAHLHLPTQGALATIAISDTAFDFVNTFPPDAESGPIRDKDAYELGNDIRVRTPQGESTVTDATSISRHDVGGLKHQRLVELDSGDAASRTAKATAILAESKNERITYECEIGPLTAAQVNQIPPGSLVNVTSQVMGLSSSTQRVAARTLRYHHPGKWMVGLELGYPVRVRIKPPRTANPIQPPYVPCDPDRYLVGVIPSGSLSCIIDVGEGNACTTFGQDGRYSELYVGATYAYQFSVFHGTNSYELEASLQALGGSFFQAFRNMGSKRLGTDVSFAAGEFVATITQVQAVLNHTPFVGLTPVNCSIGASIWYVSGPDPRFETLEACPPPLYGQPVTNEFTTGGISALGIVSSSVANPTVITTVSAHGLTTGDSVVIDGHTGSTPALDGTRVVTVLSATTFTVPVNVTVAGSGGTVSKVFTTNFPYLPGSLEVLIPAGVGPIELDPEAGTFMLP